MIARFLISRVYASLIFLGQKGQATSLQVICYCRRFSSKRAKPKNQNQNQKSDQDLAHLLLASIPDVLCDLQTNTHDVIA